MKVRTILLIILGLVIVVCLIGAALFALGIAFSDPGSSINITPVNDACLVTMRGNADGFKIEMQLACDANGSSCYQITSLTCQGVEKPNAVPIDLTVTDGCPGADWCIDSCSAGLVAPGRLWDTPSLLAVDGCNTYTSP